jgi:hypothetical protein
LEVGYQRKQVFQTIGLRLKNNDGDGKFWEILLKGWVLINRHKDIELSLSESEEFPVFNTSPPQLEAL